MLNRLNAQIQFFIACVIAWRISKYCEKHTLMRLLDQVHPGASVEWLSELVEVRGRHALVVAHH